MGRFRERWVKHPGLVASRHRVNAAKQALLPAWVQRPCPLVDTNLAALRPREIRLAQRHSRAARQGPIGSLRDTPSVS